MIRIQHNWNGWQVKICVVLIFSILGQCKKEDAVSIPQIIITKPLVNHTCLPDDTIFVEADIEASSNIELIEIKLVNAHKVPVSSSKIIYPQASQYSLSTQYVIQLSDNTEGVYYLAVIAKTKTGEKKQYQKINITGSDPAFAFWIAITEKPNFLEIIKIDSSYHAEKLVTLPGDYSKSGVSKNHLFVSGYYSNVIYAYSIQPFAEIWEKSFQYAPSFPVITDIFVSPQAVFAAFYSGSIKGFRYSGETFLTIEMQDNMIPSQVSNFNPYIVSYYSDASTSDAYLNLFYEQTGQSYVKTPLPVGVVDCFQLSENELLIFGNDPNGNGKIFHYNIMNFTLSEPYLLNSGLKITTVSKLNNEDFIIALNNCVRWYNYAHNSMVDIASQVSAEKTIADNQAQTVGFTQENKVFLYSFPELEMLDTIVCNHRIKNFHFVYE